MGLQDSVDPSPENSLQNIKTQAILQDQWWTKCTCNLRVTIICATIYDLRASGARKSLL